MIRKERVREEAPGYGRAKYFAESPLIKYFLFHNLETSKHGKVYWEFTSCFRLLSWGRVCFLFLRWAQLVLPSQVLDWDMPQGRCLFLSTCLDRVVVNGPLPEGAQFHVEE